MSMHTVELGSLGMDRGAHLIIKHALQGLPCGTEIQVVGSCRNLGIHLGAWCRS